MGVAVGFAVGWLVGGAVGCGVAFVGGTVGTAVGIGVGGNVVIVIVGDLVTVMPPSVDGPPPGRAGENGLGVNFDPPPAGWGGINLPPP